MIHHDGFTSLLFFFIAAVKQLDLFASGASTGPRPTARYFMSFTADPYCSDFMSGSFSPVKDSKPGTRPRLEELARAGPSDKEGESAPEKWFRVPLSWQVVLENHLKYSKTTHHETRHFAGYILRDVMSPSEMRHHPALQVCFAWIFK